MTREEAQTKRYIIESTEYNVPTMKEHIDKIYDDFESRVCENCSRVNDPCEIALVAFYDEGMNLQYFGCNKFERKDNP